MTIVLKFGGSSIKNDTLISEVSSIIKNKFNNDKKIIVVFSAFGKTTEKLLKCVSLSSAGNAEYLDYYNQIYDNNINILKKLFENNQSLLNTPLTEIKHILNNLKDFFAFIDDLERKDWFSIYLNSIVNQLDPHTVYLAPQAKDVFEQNISGRFQGIGARLLKKNQQVEIAEIIIGGPVWRDKLLNVGDLILGVSQTPDEEPVDI